MKNVIIVNKNRLKESIDLIKKNGHQNFFVLSDFDGTLTKVFYKRKMRPSLISILRDEKYLGLNYSKKATALYEKYHPVETDPKVSFQEKIKKMEEWWRAHYKLLRECKLERGHLKKVINSGKIELRQGIGTFFNILKENQIPLVIFSSSGMGGEIILLILKKTEKLFKNIFVASNNLKWNKKGKFVGPKEPIIHSLNKDGFILKKIPTIFKNIKKRKNVLLLGNDINDLKMLNGLNIKKAIKIGFLNEKIKENLKEYKKYFDILVLKDGSMKEVNELLKKILKARYT